MKSEEHPRLWGHALNELRDRERGQTRGRVVYWRWWLHGVPRLLLLCRVFGHKAVVDGVGDPDAESRRRGLVSRWVCCDRCGDRPNPQGSLSPTYRNIGDRYRGPMDGSAVEIDRAVMRRPGPWGWMPRGVVGGEIVVGAGHGGLGWELKIGNAGSEHTLALAVHFGWLGALYLHTEQIGVWLQRRLNPTGYESRLIGFEIGWLDLRWKLWAKRNSSSHNDPWWQEGRIRFNLLDRLFGPKRYSYENIDEPATVVLRMPHGDDHEVKLQLQRQTHGRRRQIRRRPVKWLVDCDIHGGVPVKRGSSSGVWGCAVEIPTGIGRRDHPDPWHTGQWIGVGLAALALRLSNDRARNGYPAIGPSVPDGLVLVDDGD